METDSLDSQGQPTRNDLLVGVWKLFLLAELLKQCRSGKSDAVIGTLKMSHNLKGCQELSAHTLIVSNKEKKGDLYLEEELNIPPEIPITVLMKNTALTLIRKLRPSPIKLMHVLSPNE